MSDRKSWDEEMISTGHPDGNHAADEDRRRGRAPLPFFPDFALIEALTALVLLIGLLLVASLTRPSLEEVADPTSAGYTPRPEWYFLWFFQTLKYFKGETEVVGTVVLPGIAIALLVALPFLDRRERTRALLPGTRAVRLWPRIVAAGAILGIGFLTLTALRTPTPMSTGPELSSVEAAGQAIFDKMGCASCHAIAGAGGTTGPDLTTFGVQQDARERVLLHFTDVARGDGSIMPGYQLSPEELSSLSAYLLGLKGR
jgi:ubiquinol-cytochrome c reductase cytochrome b subunit